MKKKKKIKKKFDKVEGESNEMEREGEREI